MTSSLLRKVLVAGAAVAALSVAACNKPATTTDASNNVTADTSNAAAPANAMTADASNNAMAPAANAMAPAADADKK